MRTTAAPLVPHARCARLASRVLQKGQDDAEARTDCRRCRRTHRLNILSITLLGVGQTNVEALVLSLDKLYSLRDSGPGGEHFYNRLFDFCHLQVRIALDGSSCCAAGLCRSARTHVHACTQHAGTGGGMWDVWGAGAR